MLSSDQVEGDLYFDSLECLSSEEPARKDELGCDHLDYNIWLKQPQSVEARRRSFYKNMDLPEFVCRDDGEAFGLERMVEWSNAVLRSSDCNSSEEEPNSVCCGGEEHTSGANVMSDEMEDLVDELNEDVQSQEFEHGKLENRYVGKQRMKSWWKYFADWRKTRRDAYSSKEQKSSHDRTNVKQNKKKCMEFSGMYIGQEIQAHEGCIWTMKFSPDGQYLATGGDDGVVRVWRVASIDASSKPFKSQCSCGGSCGVQNSGVFHKRMNQVSIVIPEKIFKIEESPLHEFQGHESDILDLAWSHSNMLLSSSADKTVRLWQVGCSHCLDVFSHCDYVTCVQFNPVDENKFITGSIDGKVRVWGIPEKRVVDWAEAHDIISAISYQPNGTGFVVGSITGSCRFYQFSGNDLQLEAELRIHSRKRSGNRITGIQFSKAGSKRLMISSEDSKLRIFDGLDLVQKFKGLTKAGSQLSASFTSAGRHIVSVGEDSHVYLWNFDEPSYPWSKQIRSVRACEHFLSEGVSVAIPWSAEMSAPSNAANPRSTLVGSSAPSLMRSNQQRFSLGNWFSMDARSKFSSATWPEERLPIWDGADCTHQDLYHDQSEEISSSSQSHNVVSDAWGLVIVTAAWDGSIRTYHNYGLPIRL